MLPGEHRRLAEVTLAAYRVLGPLPEDYAAELADVGGRASDPRVVVLAARLAGQVVGGITVVLAPGSPLAPHLRPGSASLRMLAVDPAAEGAGAGRALVAAALELGRRRDLTRVDLHTQAVMERARRIYVSMGFVRDPEGDVLLASGHRLIGYTLSLRPASR